jgi:GNAT superfamily N-acetyltransferase
LSDAPRIAIRPYRAADNGVVLGPWARQIRSLAPFTEMTTEEFNEHMHGVCCELIRRCTPLLAVHPDYSGQVFGWICSEIKRGQQILHFVYVRKPFRQMGIASALLDSVFPKLGEAPVFLTHPSKTMRYHKDRWRLHYNPYLVMQ